MGRYAAAFQSLTDPERFWGAAAGGIDWYHRPTVVLDKSNPPFYRWFADGTLNTCFNAVDRHVRDGHGDQVAVIYDSPVTGTGRKLTYRQLLDEVARFAGVLRDLSTGAGDRVIIYMPMIPEAIVAMLACARLESPRPTSPSGRGTASKSCSASTPNASMTARRPPTPA